MAKKPDLDTLRSEAGELVEQLHHLVVSRNADVAPEVRSLVRVTCDRLIAMTAVRLAEVRQAIAAHVGWTGLPDPANPRRWVEIAFTAGQTGTLVDVLASTGVQVSTMRAGPDASALAPVKVGDTLVKGSLLVFGVWAQGDRARVVAVIDSLPVSGEPSVPDDGAVDGDPAESSDGSVEAADTVNEPSPNTVDEPAPVVDAAL